MKLVPLAPEPEIQERQRHVAELLLQRYPEVSEPYVEKGIEKGIEQLALHQFERRLQRPLLKHERETLHERLRRLGPDRIADVVVDLSPAELLDWLADPAAG